MKKIGIIGAMDVEVERLKADMTVTRQITKAQMHFWEGPLKNQPVVVVRSGLGKVNAAVCTQILVDEFGVDAVINTGIAGSLNAQIDIGDIVISTDVLHHDMDAVNFGYAPGQIPQMEVFSFVADEPMAELAEKVCHQSVPGQSRQRRSVYLRPRDQGSDHGAVPRLLHGDGGRSDRTGCLPESDSVHRDPGDLG